MILNNTLSVTTYGKRSIGVVVEITELRVAVVAASSGSRDNRKVPLHPYTENLFMANNDILIRATGVSKDV